jgi:hypothetical protein
MELSGPGSSFLLKRFLVNARYCIMDSSYVVGTNGATHQRPMTEMFRPCASLPHSIHLAV